MKNISDYKGNLLNHLEGVYRPGDRPLVLELFEALNLVALEIKFTETMKPLVAIHPNGEDRDATNNIIFLSEMSGPQLAFEDLMQKKIEADPEMNAAMADYRDRVTTRPSGIPHFGFRYPSKQALEAVIEKLKTTLSPALKDRVSVREAPPYPVMAGMPDIRQVFVYTDVFTAGPIAYGQLIELQVVREPALAA